MSSLNQSDVKIRFFMPDEALKPYISTYYVTEVKPSEEAPIVDWLHPEWANLRFIEGSLPNGAIGDQETMEAPRFSIVGPTSQATRFESGAMQSWGIGLLPLGWEKFVGASAEHYADKTTDGNQDEKFSRFRPLHHILFGDEALKPDQQAQRIAAFFHNLLDTAPPDNPLTRKAHEILVDPDLGTVQEMADRLEIIGRSLDRLSRKVFGFPPKLLLRRQRFLRSLAENMLNPSQNWVSSIDPQYYDQAHFGRDFQRFMGMSASAYKALPHPFMNAAVHGRMAAAGAGMQALHDPSASPS